MHHPCPSDALTRHPHRSEPCHHNHASTQPERSQRRISRCRLAPRLQFNARHARSPCATLRHRTSLRPGERALLAGFVTQLLLILFVTAIGLQQLAVTTDNLDTGCRCPHAQAEPHQNHGDRRTRAHADHAHALHDRRSVRARRTCSCSSTSNGAEFADGTRWRSQSMPLNSQRTRADRPAGVCKTRHRPADPGPGHRSASARTSTRKPKIWSSTSAIPAQNNVLAVLSQLDAETQKLGAGSQPQGEP